MYTNWSGIARCRLIAVRYCISATLAKTKYRSGLGLETTILYIDGLVHGCSNHSALAMQLLQSCAKPSICTMNSIECLALFETKL